MPTTEHTELRPLGKTIARHVERGFETLVVSTAEHVRCEGDRLDGGAEVRIQGGADTRKPWSAWFASLPIRGADGNGASEEERAGRAPAAARARRAPNRARLPAASVQRDARAFSVCAARCRAAGDQFARAARLGRRVRPPRRRQRLGRVRDRARAPALSRGAAEGGRVAARCRRSGAGPEGGEGEGGEGEGQGGRGGRRQAVAGRATAGDAAAARALGAGAPDGYHHGDDVVAGDAADRPRLAGRRRRSRDRAAVGAEAAVFQAAPVGGDDGGARASGPVRAAGRVGARGVLLRAVPDNHAADQPARGAGCGHRARARGNRRGGGLRSRAPLRGRARPAAGTADEAARPGGGRQSRGRRQRSLPARRQRLSRSCFACARGPPSRRRWRGRWRRSAPRTAG